MGSWKSRWHVRRVLEFPKLHHLICLESWLEEAAPRTSVSFAAIFCHFAGIQMPSELPLQFISLRTSLLLSVTFGIFYRFRTLTSNPACWQSASSSSSSSVALGIQWHPPLRARAYFLIQVVFMEKDFPSAHDRGAEILKMLHKKDTFFTWILTDWRNIWAIWIL